MILKDGRGGEIDSSAGDVDVTTNLIFVVSHGAGLKTVMVVQACMGNEETFKKKI